MFNIGGANRRTSASIIKAGVSKQLTLYLDFYILQEAACDPVLVQSSEC